MSGPFQLGSVGPSDGVPADVSAASTAWLAAMDVEARNRDAKGAKRARLIYVTAAVAVVLFAGLVATAAIGDFGFGGFLVGWMFLTVFFGGLAAGSLILFVFIPRQGSKKGRASSLRRMQTLEQQYPGWFSCEYWRSQYDTQLRALRGPK